MSVRELGEDLAAAIAADVVYPLLLVEIDSADGFIRVHSGIGDLSWDSKTWTGTGDLGGISAIDESTDVQANGVRFTLSGVPSALLSYALTHAEQGRAAKVWLACFDAAGEMQGDPYLLFTGLTDVPTIEDSGDTAVIGITAESRLIDLERARVRRYTPEDQKLTDPDDKGFDFVAGLQEAEIIFGRS